MRRMLIAIALLSGAAARIDAQARASGVQVIESFDSVSAFRALPSDGVRLTLRADSGVAPGRGSAMRMEYDFQGRAGYAVARRAFSLPALPPHFAVTLWVRGHAMANTLELKLVDSSGLNVWWLRRPELTVLPGWTQVRFRSSDLTYAWGPLGGGEPRGIAALEIAFTAGPGGRGWLALDDLTLTPLAAPVGEQVRPRARTSSVMRGAESDSVLGADFSAAPIGAGRSSGRGWRSSADGVQWMELDFGGTRQLSALVMDWSDADWPTDYDIESSNDGRNWSLLRAVRASAGGRRWVHLPLTEAARLRLVLHASSRGRGYALERIHVLSDSMASTRSAFLERVAQGSAPGLWPRSLTGQQSYWTIVGLRNDTRDALVSEDGAVESRPGGFSVEPFLRAGDTLLTWRDGEVVHTLDAGWRPIPTVERTTASFALATTVFATGEPASSVVWIRYRVRNLTTARRTATLAAALRAVQVNPPWQFLGTPGGAATIRTLQWSGRALTVNDTDAVIAVTPGAQVSLVAFDAGPAITAPAPGSSGPARISDPSGLAEGVVTWRMVLPPHDSAEAWIALPAIASRKALASIPTVSSSGAAARAGERQLAQARRQLRLGVENGDAFISLPRDGGALVAAMRTALEHIRINASGPAIQPGTRSYRRSWIRDGALTSEALRRLGRSREADAFLDWFLPNVFADGKVPCCVDRRGADPVTENDADGELLYLASQSLRYGHSPDVTRRRWPTLKRVAMHLDSLRLSRRTSKYTTPDSLLVFGLLPPSISHEGYSAKPAYSYWDDWWGVRGLDDAAAMARAVGDNASASRFALAGREMRSDVVASVRRSMALHHIETLPGAAELGDLDPTSTTIALDPANALSDLPRAAVQATFDSAWVTLQRRMAPGSAWEIFTPYEWRDVGAFLRLGQPERAHEYAAWLMSMRRPLAWNQWSEAVWRAPRTPKFIGDMPHGWVASDFIRATLDMLVYERASDSTMVVAAGIPLAWVRRDTVRVTNLKTGWGTFDLLVTPIAGGVAVRVGGAHGPGGLEIRAPFGAPVRRVTVDGVPATLIDDGRAVRIRTTGVLVEFFY